MPQTVKQMHSIEEGWLKKMKLFFLNSARRQIPLFANKKKDLVRIELTFDRKIQLLSE